MLRVVPLAHVRANLGLGELTDGLTKELLLVGESEIHACLWAGKSYHWARNVSRLPKGAATRMRLQRLLILSTLALLSTALPARADLTAFIGTQSAPSMRTTTGISAGMGVLIVGFEGEYAQAHGDDLCPAATASSTGECAPSLRTVMGNLLIQTPRGIVPRLQFYGTIGGGYFRERFEPIGRAEHRFRDQRRRRREDRSGGTAASPSRLPDLQAGKRRRVRDVEPVHGRREYCLLEVRSWKCEVLSEVGSGKWAGRSEKARRSQRLCRDRLVESVCVARSL